MKGHLIRVVIVFGLLSLLITINHYVQTNTPEFRRAAERGHQINAIAQPALSDQPGELPAYDRWFIQHSGEEPVSSWDDKGFHPRRSKWPRDVQILWSAIASKSDISNGGFYQFFTNETGEFAPEFHEFLIRTNYTRAAQVLQQAMSHFPKPFPRSQLVRRKQLPKPSGARADWDPFFELDADFDHAFGDGPDIPDAVCESWMRDFIDVQR